MKIALTKGFSAEIDRKDYSRLAALGPWQYHSSSTGRTGYAITYFPLLNWRNAKLVRRQFRVFMHDLIMNPKTGEEVDHVDGNGLNNRRNNLRNVTRQQQCFNRSLQPNDSGYKGVSRKHYKLLGDRWHAHITLNRKQIHIGTFDSKEDAALAYNAFASELFGEFAKLNSVPNRAALRFEDIGDLTTDKRSIASQKRSRKKDGTFNS